MISPDGTFSLARDANAGQVTLEGPPAGPAGGAALVPADGIELLFDNADGRLARVVVDLGEPGGAPVIGEAALGVVNGMFGPRAGHAIRQADSRAGTLIPLRAGPETVAALSRLARLDAARVISPVAHSPWWAVEAAQLATRAGLSARAAAETRQAAHALEGAGDAPLAGMTGAVVLAVADLVEPAEPGLAKQLRDHAIGPQPGGWASGQHSLAETTALRATEHRYQLSRPADDRLSRAEGIALRGAVRHADRGGGRDFGDVQCWLDPQLAPPGVFQHGLWIDAELTVRAGRRGLVVTAELAPGGSPDGLRQCRARLVDPAERKVLALAAFSDEDDSRARAIIRGIGPAGGCWVEVVDDESRPVISAQLRHIRRAMRWADVALYAARRSPGLGDPRWAGLAAQAWERCAADWSAGGDPDRAYLAAVRRAAIDPDNADDLDDPVPAAPAAWARELAGRPVLTEAGFLAETLD